MALNHSGRSRSGGRGASRLGCLFSLIILIGAGYFGVVYIGSEVDYRSLSGEMQRQAGLAAELSDPEILQNLQRQVRDLGLPPAAEQIMIRRQPGNLITLSTQYPETLTFFGRWEWNRTRRIRVEQSY